MDCSDPDCRNAGPCYIPAPALSPSAFAAVALMLLLAGTRLLAARQAR